MSSRICSGLFLLTAVDIRAGAVLRASFLVSALLFGLLTGPAQAQVKEWTGADSGDWFAPVNWDPAGVPVDDDQIHIDTVSPNPTLVSGAATGGPASASLGEIRIGLSNRGELVIRDGGRVSNFTSWIASQSGGEGMVTVTGAGSEWDSDERLWVGDFGDGVLTIEEGGVVFSRSSVVGSQADVTGDVIVTGSGSEWDTRGTLFLGSFGSGSLTISDGAQTRHTGARFATFPGSTGSLLVTGAGSGWNDRGGAVIGYSGTATILVEGGGFMSNDGGYLGVEPGGQGTAVITGEGSRWVIQELFNPEPDFRIGGEGTGAVTIANGAEMSVEALLILAEGSGSDGTLNIGSGDAAGRLSASELYGGDGNATLNFNHSDPGFHFTSDGTVDGSPVLVSGSTAVNHVGSGITVLTADHSYSGFTSVDNGTLVLTGSVSSRTLVNSGGRLSGDGSAQVVTVFDGGRLAPGNPVGTIQTATLSLRQDALLEMDLAEPGVVGGGVNDLIDVDGNLVLDGIVQINPQAGFAEGTYTLITYSLEMLDRELAIAPDPRFDARIDVSQAGQVNLIVEAVREPPTISLVAPDNGATDIPRAPLFQWQVAPEADSFELQVAPDISFEAGELAIDLDDLVETQHQAGVELAEGVTWFWRVRGTNDAGPGAWSEAWSFTTFAALPEIDLTKQITDGDPYSAVGDSIAYSLTAANTGNVILSDVGISDPDAVIGDCNPMVPATLAPGEALVCQASHAASQADLDAGSFTNTARAVAIGPDAEIVEAVDSATAGAMQNPLLALVKSSSAERFIAAGDVIDYTIIATNEGNVSLAGLTVVDVLLDALECTPMVPAQVAPGQQVECSGTHVATDDDVAAGGIVNIATANSDQTDPVDATATVELELIPEVLLNPMSMDFGAVLVNEGNEVRTLMLENIGNGEMHLGSVSELPPPFTLAGGSCLPAPRVIAAGEDCTILVAFAPTGIGKFVGEFEIISDAPSSPDAVGLTGNGIISAMPVPAGGPVALVLLVLLFSLTGGLILLPGARVR